MLMQQAGHDELHELVVVHLTEAESKAVLIQALLLRVQDLLRRFLLPSLGLGLAISFATFVHRLVGSLIASSLLEIGGGVSALGFIVVRVDFRLYLGVNVFVGNALRKVVHGLPLHVEGSGVGVERLVLLRVLQFK